MTLNKKFYHYQTTNRMVYTLVLRNFLNVRAIFYLLSFRLKQKKIRYLPQISIFHCEKNRRVSLEHKSYIKYLGVLIDENLSWKNHLDCVITKISKTIGMIAKLRHFVPSSVLTNIYKSLVLPYLTYGLVAWRNASKNFLNKIVVLQKRVLLLISFVDRKEYAIPLFVNAKILPITFLYYEAVCKLMFDVHNDGAPSNITKLFTRTSNIHTYNTRSSTSQFFSVKYSRLKMQKKSLFACWCQSLEWDAKRIQKFVKEILQKRNKKSSSQYSRNWRFLYGAWWDNTKIQTQQNWIKLNQFYNIFRTLRNARIFFSFTMNICHFPFFLFFFSFFFLRIFLSCYVLFLHFRFISSVIKWSQ